MQSLQRQLAFRVKSDINKTFKIEKKKSHLFKIVIKSQFSSSAHKIMAVQTLQTQGSPRESPIVEWIPFEDVSTSSIPNGSLIGGTDSGIDLYIIRTRYGGHIIPGKLISYPTHHVASITYSGVEIHVQNFQVLKVAPEFITWTSFQEPCDFPPNPLKLTSDASNFYIGRAPFEGTVTIGKIDYEKKCLYISYKGREISIFNNFEVLCCNYMGINDYCSVMNKSKNSNNRSSIIAGQIEAIYETIIKI